MIHTRRDKEERDLGQTTVVEGVFKICASICKLFLFSGSRSWNHHFKKEVRSCLFLKAGVKGSSSVTPWLLRTAGGRGDKAFSRYFS